MKKVLITIRGAQKLSENKEVIELMTEGVMRKNGEDYILNYNDSQILGENEKVRTRLTVRGTRRLTIERSDAVKARMVVEKGVRNNCIYGTPHGDLMLGVYGKNIESNLSDSGGQVSVTYTLDAGMRFLSENEIQITVKEV